MKSILKIGGIVLTVALGAGLVIWALRTPERESLSETAPDVAQGPVADERSTVTGGTASEASGTIVAQPEPEQNAEPESASASGDADSEPEMTEEEKAAAEEERLVEAFDNLTDKWMEPAKDGVTMQDIDTFVRQFKSVPADRKDECLHRALNLVPDENVMLLAGILLGSLLRLLLLILFLLGRISGVAKYEIKRPSALGCGYLSLLSRDDGLDNSLVHYFICN